MLSSAAQSLFSLKYTKIPAGVVDPGPPGVYFSPHNNHCSYPKLMTGTTATQTLATGTAVIFISITSTTSTQPPVASTVAIQTSTTSTAAALIPVTTNTATTFLVCYSNPSNKHDH